MIKVHVYAGVGSWMTKAVVNLVACPHVGDTIDVNEVTVTCDSVHITKEYVIVQQTIHFTSEEQAKQHFPS